MRKYFSGFFLFSVLLFSAICMSSNASTEISVFRSVMKDFQQNYQGLGQLTPASLTILSKVWQSRLAEKLSVTKPYRVIDSAKLIYLESLLQKEGGKIVMRHAEQKLTEDIAKIPSYQEKKIAMMRSPHNMEDPPTKHSLVEFFGLMIAFSYLQERTGRELKIFSSPNQRASVPAKLLSEFLGTSYEKKRCLQCVNYPPEEQLSSACLLRELSSGTLPWERESVDFILGDKAHERILQTMERYLSCTHKHSTISVTHTQQINALQQLLSMEISRLPYYGFIVVSEGKGYLFTHGIYVSDK